MNKKILMSLSVIAAVAAVAIGGTVAWFRDTEKSTGNILSAGVIDIVVDGQNPWNKTFTDKLTDMKPSYTKYITFTVKNLVNRNEVNLWKHINITSQTDGVITEPECEEGGGTWTGATTECRDKANCCTGTYAERNNLAAYIIYDMYVCADPSDTKCKTDNNNKPENINEWTPIITEDQYVRLDNVNSAWIKLGQLSPAKELKVVQSYHLRSWPGAPESDVTNWAQGDELTFDIELMATQLNAPGPKGLIATLEMENKNCTTWDPITNDNVEGTLTYNTSGETFNYTFVGKVKTTSNYTLLYVGPSGNYPCNGSKVIATSDFTAGTEKTLTGSIDLGTGIVNGKIWLVPTSSYNGGVMTGWPCSDILFEMQFITYEDTNN